MCQLDSLGAGHPPMNPGGRRYGVAASLFRWFGATSSCSSLHLTSFVWIDPPIRCAPALGRAQTCRTRCWKQSRPPWRAAPDSWLERGVPIKKAKNGISPFLAFLASIILPSIGGESKSPCSASLPSTSILAGTVCLSNRFQAICCAFTRILPAEPAFPYVCA